MPARRYALYFSIALLLDVTYVAAQTPNPHTAIPAQQQHNYPGGQQRPGNLPPTSAPSTQTGFPSASTNPTSSGAVPANSQVPQVPLLPSQMPPKPPRISYAGGQLTVIADNSTMGDILNAVRSATGIKMEGTSGGSDRVYGQYGPASPRVILDSLLSGSHYDFIILSSLENPEVVQRVILSPRGNSPPSSVNASNQPPFSRPPADEDNDNTPDEVTNEQPVPMAPPGMQQPGQSQTPGQPQNLGQPQTVVPVPINGQNQAQQQSNGTPQVKTPEQLLEELRRLNGNRRQNEGEGPRTPQQPPDIVPR